MSKFSRYDFKTAPIENPEPQYKGGWIVGLAVVLVIIGMSAQGVVS